jgi:sulfhydrogenase subunit beta (sulfur reductase)
MGNSIADKSGVLGRDGLAALIAALRDRGYETVGPVARDGAVVYEPVENADQLPWGLTDEQAGGHYRLKPDESGAAFAHTVGPQSWKKYLYPPRQTLWSGERAGKAFTIETPVPEPKPYAFIGMRACELAAITVQDKVFGYARHQGRAVGQQQFADSGYVRRRGGAFFVAVNCARSADTCFCCSMDGGPEATAGYDLRLAELVGDGRHEFLIDAGSEKGAAVLAGLQTRPATPADHAAAKVSVERAAAMQTRKMVADPARLLADNLEHPQWAAVAERCLNCANCTMVCPTCFCTTVEDVTDLTGDKAERVRRWDSCFTMDFSYIHGGSIRQSGQSRYRQWMTHKLSHWTEQFGTSGCTGCGRCISWCPVGIDITEETAAIAASPKNKQA